MSNALLGAQDVMLSEDGPLPDDKLDAIPRLRLLPPWGYEFDGIFFHTEYGTISLKDLEVFPQHFAHALNTIGKDGYDLEQKVMLQELFRRNREAFNVGYNKRYYFGPELSQVEFVTLDELLESNEKALPYYSVDQIGRYGDLLPSTLRLPRLPTGAIFICGPTSAKTYFAMDPLSGRTAYHNSDRANRPFAKSPPVVIASADDLFSLENVLKTPPELLRIFSNGTIAWGVGPHQLAWACAARVFPNLFEGIDVETYGWGELSEQEMERYNAYISTDEGRKHLDTVTQLKPTANVMNFFREVYPSMIVTWYGDTGAKDGENRGPVNLGRSSWEHFQLIAKAALTCQGRMLYTEDGVRRPGIKYVKIFENSGKEAGASLDHPHVQVSGVPMEPPEIERMVKKASIHGHHFFEDMFDFYRRMGFTIAARGNAVAYASPWAKFPGTIELYLTNSDTNSLRELKANRELNVNEWNDFMGLTHTVLSALGEVPYDFLFREAPPDSKVKIPLHVLIVPRFRNVPAGFEMDDDELSGYHPVIHAQKIANMIRENTSQSGLEYGNLVLKPNS